LGKPNSKPGEHKSKEWKACILEFIVIFLAVSLGFIAEELRENRNESRNFQRLNTTRNEVDGVIDFVCDAGSKLSERRHLLRFYQFAFA
jgi:hypothetical protein